MEDPSPYGEGEELWWGAGKNNREGEIHNEMIASLARLPNKSGIAYPNQYINCTEPVWI